MAGSYSVRLRGSPERELNQLPKKEIARILERLQQLGQQPRPPGCEKLSAVEGYRVRQGDYRILYTIDDKSRVVEIVKIGHRREVYR